MHQLFLCVLFCLLCVTGYAKQTDSIMMKLNQVMNDKERYVAIKEQNIEKIKQTLTAKNLSLNQKYEINHQIFKEYHKFGTDSAIVYMLKNREIAIELNDPEKINETAIYLALVYSKLGLYIETYELLNGINRNTLSDRLIPVYYETYVEFLSHYELNSKIGTFFALSGQYRDTMLLQYRDSILFSMDTLSFQYHLEMVSRKMFSNHNLDQEEALLNLLEEAGQSPDKAYVAWLLGYMYHREVFEFHRKEYGKISKKYYIISVISDVKNCIRDNASMQSLALVFFDQNEIALANKFIYYAFEDALACNVHFRILDISTNYPIINELFQQQEKKQMIRLYTSLIAISLFLIILMISLLLFLRQNRKLSLLSRALSHANNNLKELNFVKDKLFSVVAHDLRSPMVALMTMLKLFNTDKLDTEKQARLLRDVSTRVGNTFGLLDNLLRWAKSQMQGMAPSLAFFDIQEESHAVTDTLQSFATVKKIALENHIGKHQVYADRDMLAVVIRNLITNAIKYTSANGTVILNSELKDNMLIVSVEDTGTGMSQEVQEKLFKLSETQSQSGTNNETGTGLGLVLCADLVKANGGNIWFTSVQGEGSTFFFSVPVKC